MTMRAFMMLACGLALATAAQGAQPAAPAQAPRTYSSWSVSATLKEPAGHRGTATIEPGIGSTTFTATSQDYVIRAAAGYDIKSVIVDGRASAVTNADLKTVKFDNTRLLHTLFVTMVPEKYNISTSVTPARKGAFSPASLKNIAYGTLKTIRITPAKGYEIASVTETPTDRYGAPTGGAVSLPVTDPKSMTLTYGSTTGYRKLVASFDLKRQIDVVLSPSGERTLDVTNGPASLRLDGARSTSIVKPMTYTWKLDGAPDSSWAELTAAPTKPDPAVRTFTARKPGIYTATLTVSDGTISSAATARFIVQSVKIGESGSCITCHTTEVDPYSGKTISTSYQTSGHAQNSTGPSCTSCHGDHNTGIKEYPYNACSGCHNGTTTVKFGTVEHFTGGTATGTAGYIGAAGAAGTKVSCSSCHFDVDSHGLGADAATTSLFKKYGEKLAEWASSGHGNRNSAAWTSDANHNWKHEGTAGVNPASAVGGDCVRCHTPQGFAKFVKSGYADISPWGDAGDASSFTLNCSACHDENARGATTGAVRDAGRFTAWLNTNVGATTVKVSYQYPDVDQSNLCISCHTGSASGQTIKAAAAAGANFGDLPFINSHYLAAAGTIYRSSGYHFEGQDYANNSHFQHDQAGKNDGTGPCVSCHMGSTKNHSWKIVTRNESTGAIVSVATTGCVGCHGTIPVEMFDSGRRKLAAATAALKAALQTKGIYYAPTYPYFFRSAGDTSMANAFRNWNAVYPGKGKDVMGAAFNLNLAINEQGMYAHNRMYSAKLLQDSIDFIDDGELNGTTNSTIIGLSGITAEQRANATNFLAVAGGDNCISCHTAASSLSIEKPNHFAEANIGTNFTNPAFKSYTAIGKRKAQYVAEATSCADCHNGFNVSDQAREWAASGKGDTASAAYTKYDFKTRGTSGASTATSAATDCVRCHTTTGYLNYITSGSIAPLSDGTTDKTLEVLQCNVCHYSPLDDNATRREVPAVTAYYNYSSSELSTQKGIKRVLVSQNYPNVGTSNICLNCHTGRQSGKTVQAVAATGVDFGNLPFINSHYLTAGGTVFGKTGYQFNGRNYDRPTTFAHDSIGEDEGSGPCVSCHMSSSEKHSFSPVRKDGLGTVTTVSTTLCNSCHSADPAGLNNTKQKYEAALDALKGALFTKGIYYASTNPYFFKDTNGNNVLDPGEITRTNAFKEWGSTDIMGAAFNYNLLRHDLGAYTHNSIYVRRLIADSICTLMARNDIPAAIDAVVSAGKLDAGQAALAKSYLGAVRP